MIKNEGSRRQPKAAEEVEKAEKDLIKILTAFRACGTVGIKNTDVEEGRRMLFCNGRKWPFIFFSLL